MAAPFIKTSFAHGEIAPSLWGHVDVALYGSAAATCRNMYVGYRGGAHSRAGTAYVGRSKQIPFLQSLPRIIPFQFSLSQGLALEFGDNYLRFISKGGHVVETAVAISGITQAAIGVVTTLTPHGYANNDWVSFGPMEGMGQLIGQTCIVLVTSATTFDLLTLDGLALDTTAYQAYIAGGTVSRIYEISTPYAALDLPLLKFTQSADVMSLTHPNYPPYELSRLGPTSWSLTAASFAASIAAPGNVAARATVNPSAPTTLPCAFAYEVTAVDPKTGQESVASSVIGNVTDSVDIAATAGSIIVDWAAVAGAGTYKIYKAPTSYNTDPTSSTDALPVPVGSLFGLIGISYGLEFTDSNITADFAQTPPLHKNPFAPGQIIGVSVTASSADWPTSTTCSITTATGSGFIGQVVVIGGAISAVIVTSAGQGYASGDTISFAGGGTSASATLDIGPATGTYPGVVSYFQERRVYAQSLNNPDTYWMSQPGAFLNFDSAIPVIDSDAITGTPFAEQVNGIQWMVSMPLGLVTFTGNGIWQIGASGTFLTNPSAITPANQMAIPQSSVGSSPVVQPIRINWDILYVQSKGYTVRSLSYQVYFNIYTGVDVSWPSSHLLIGHQITQWAWCEEPYRVVWAVRDDGVLLSLTYLKEQEVNGWARHDTQGQVVSVCAVVEPPVDALYMVVSRIVSASAGYKYFIERMDDRIWSGIEDSWCVDCGVATALPTPNAALFAGSGSGAGASFQSFPGVFTGASVGQIIRSGGGIALVTSYAGPDQVYGTWLYPCQQLLPNDPTGLPLPQSPGAWSIATPLMTVYGLSHLIGKTIVGLADGIPVSARTVAADGSVTLDRAASDIKLGLGFTAQLQSVYLEAGQPTMQGRRKAISAATARLEASAPCQVGANQTDSSALSPAATFATWAMPSAIRAPEAPASYQTASGGTVYPLFTGDQRALIKAEWQKQGQVAAQQTLPVPLNVLAFIPEIVPGDEPEVGYSQRQRGQGAASSQAAPAARGAGPRRDMPDEMQMAEIGRRGGWLQ